jgi:hypothetical protein
VVHLILFLIILLDVSKCAFKINGELKRVIEKILKQQLRELTCSDGELKQTIIANEAPFADAPRPALPACCMREAMLPG